MPEWVVHFYTGEEFCRIPRSTYEELNAFADLKEHDANRVIIDGHWLPESLFYLALVVYEKWGYEGLRALIHHHLLDYSDTLASSGKYGWLVKHYGPDYAREYIKGFCGKVLDNIVNDFMILFNALKREVDVSKVVHEVKRSWGEGTIQYLAEFTRVLEGDRARLLKFLEDLLRTANELRSCLSECIEEVLWLRHWGRFGDYCPICVSFIGPSEAYVLVPEVYAQKDLAYKVHNKCFESLKTRAKELLRQGFAKEEILKKLVEKSLPPSIKYEALKAVARHSPPS
jgi:hypothetical protein